MATAAASIDDLRSGLLPSICAKTGVPETSRTEYTFVSVPRWTWVLLLFGILPFFIARSLAGVKVTGLVPLSHEATRRMRRTQFLLAALIVPGLALVVGAAVASAPTLAWIGAGLMLAGAVAWMIGWRMAWVGGRQRSEWMWLYRVHPSFARALGQQYAALPEKARPR